jgi:hypothetical protein
MKPVDDLPPALPAMWRALKRGYQAEPLLLAVSFGLSLLAALPDALMALWLKLLADGMLGGNRRLVIGASIGLSVSAVGTWFLRVISDRTQTIRVARGDSLREKVVDAPKLKLPQSDSAVANLLAFKPIPGTAPAEGLRSSQRTPALDETVVAPTPEVRNDKSQRAPMLM